MVQPSLWNSCLLSEKSCVSAAIFFLRDLGCAPKSVGIRNSSAYLAQRLDTAGLQLAAAMMTRARIIRRFKRVKFYLFRCKSADLFFSCCGSIASRGNNLGPTIKYLQKNNERRRGHRPRRPRIVRRCTRENLLFSAAHQQSCFLLLRQRRGAAATI